MSLQQKVLNWTIELLGELPKVLHSKLLNLKIISFLSFLKNHRYYILILTIAIAIIVINSSHKSPY